MSSRDAKVRRFETTVREAGGRERRFLVYARSSHPVLAQLHAEGWIPDGAEVVGIRAVPSPIREKQAEIIDRRKAPGS